MSETLDETNLLGEDDLTPEYSLMYGIDQGPRLFVFNNADSTTLLGVMLEETDDSFLVAIPSKLVQVAQPANSTGTETKIVPFIPVPYIRIFKSALLTTMYLYGEYAEKYLEYLKDKGEDIYPELLDVMDSIREQLGEEEGSEDIDEEILELSLNTDSGVEQKAEGMSDEELKDYLKNKYNKGKTDNGNAKKH